MKLERRVLWAGRILRGLGRTWRQEWSHRDRLDAARRASPGGNVIYAIWHNALATLAWTHRQQDIQVLVSHHDDGEWIARILETLGYGLVRGSSRRGGIEALFRLGQQLERDRDVAITVDGPLGPRWEVHPGVLLLARRTGRPIVPVTATADRRLELGTWDALRLPLPGSRVVLQHGEPVWIGPQVSGDELEQERRRLRDLLHRLTREEEARQGHEVHLVDIQDHRSRWERWSESARPPGVLRAVSTLYAVGARADRRLRPRPRGRGGRPWVVGVGNLEAGGTGKTPVLLHLVSEWTRHGVRCAVLTRGHAGGLGRHEPFRVDPQDVPATASDETRLMRRLLPDAVPLVVARHKHHGLESLRDDADVDLVLVDDALQTARLPVDRHLVLLDARRPLGNGHLLPAGRLREPPTALRRAAALLFTRSADARVPSHPLWDHRRGDCFVAREGAGTLSRLDDRRVEVERLRGTGVATLCGLGRPQAFEALVRDLGERNGFELRRCVRVGDHAPLERRLHKLRDRLSALACDWILLTRKDACRLQHPDADEPLLVLEQRLVIEAISDLTRKLLPEDYTSSATSVMVTEVDP